MAPCEGLQTENDYEIGIVNIQKILKGDIKSVVLLLKQKMKEYAEILEFEKADLVKEKLRLLENYQAKSTIVNTKINNVDVFTISSDNNFAFVNYLKINSGSIIQTHTIEIKKKLEESDSDLLIYAIMELRQRFNSISKEIYSSIQIDNLWEGVKVISPKIGDKYKLIELSKRNANFMRLDRFNKDTITKKRSDNSRLMDQVKNDLNLKVHPVHIECFDNSNLQGTSPVSACVVFKNGKASKKDYRYFNIKEVDGPNDYASMEEVVYRRYKRLIDEKSDLPQLIIIDGGKGQISAAFKSLDKLGITDRVQLIGIAKRLEEVFIFGDPLPLYLDKRSETLKLIQRLRNEAHRFSILHHRKKRISNTLKISLDNIQGIGNKTIEVLLSHFGTVSNIRSANKEEIIKLIGPKKTEKIIIYLQKK